MTDDASSTQAQVETAGRDYVGIPLTEDMQRTIVMAAATLAAGTLSTLRRDDWVSQMPDVVNKAFTLVLDAYRNQVATARA